MADNELAYQKGYDDQKLRTDKLDKEIQNLANENFKLQETINSMEREREHMDIDLNRARGLVDKLHMENIDFQGKERKRAKSKLDNSDEINNLKQDYESKIEKQTKFHKEVMKAQEKTIQELSEAMDEANRRLTETQQRYDAAMRDFEAVKLKTSTEIKRAHQEKEEAINSMELEIAKLKGSNSTSSVQIKEIENRYKQ